jgi:fatty acid desaturase
METAAVSPHRLNHALRTAVADLETVNPWLGFWRFLSLGAVFLSLAGLAWVTTSGWLFVVYGAIAGVVYAFWLVCTHDAVHATLTGWKGFDSWVSRLISYPMLWPYGTYAQLHRLHHAWNGIDLRDPERVQWTQAEYERASPLRQWYVRYQWPIDILIFGGLGFIAKTVYHALRLRPQFPVLSQALLWDGVGILLMQVVIGTVILLQDCWVQYLVFWFVLERVIGLILQARDHLEHYGLWRTAQGHQLTQLYACRNLTTSPEVGWLMGGLNHHAVHHAFPGIPFNHLAEAFDRIQWVLEQHELPAMMRDGGYIQETLRLGTQPCLIQT